jgi:hypothetical protein
MNRLQEALLLRLTLRDSFPDLDSNLVNTRLSGQTYLLAEQQLSPDCPRESFLLPLESVP